MTGEPEHAARVFDAIGDLLMTLGGGPLTGAVVGLAFSAEVASAALPASYLLICMAGLTSAIIGFIARSLSPALAHRLERSRL